MAILFSIGNTGLHGQIFSFYHSPARSARLDRGTADLGVNNLPKGQTRDKQTTCVPSPAGVQAAPVRGAGQGIAPPPLQSK